MNREQELSGYWRGIALYGRQRPYGRTEGSTLSVGAEEYCRKRLLHIVGGEIDAPGGRITLYPCDEDGELHGSAWKP